MKRTNWKIIAFVGCVGGLISTYLVSGALIKGNGFINQSPIKYLYNILFFSCPFIFITNLIHPIFESAIFKSPLTPVAAIFLTIMNIAVFQILIFLGMSDLNNFHTLYLKHFIILQMINLFFTWTIICGAVGQKRFHPFFKDFARNPFRAFIYWPIFWLTYCSERALKRLVSWGKRNDL